MYSVTALLFPVPTGPCFEENCENYPGQVGLSLKWGGGGGYGCLTWQEQARMCFLMQKLQKNCQNTCVTRGWLRRKEERPKKYVCIAITNFLGKFLCYRCSTLFNYNSYLYAEAFFDEIELSEV